MSREVYSLYKPEPREIMEGWNLDFYRGSILKYDLRYPYDGDPVGDTVKLYDYARMLMIREKRKEMGEQLPDSKLTDDDVLQIIKEEYNIK